MTSCLLPTKISFTWLLRYVHRVCFAWKHSEPLDNKSLLHKVKPLPVRVSFVWTKVIQQQLTVASESYKLDVAWSRLTSVAVVQVGELVPLVVLDEAEEGALDIWSHLDDELLISIQRKARRYKGDVESPTKWCDGVHRLLVVEPKDGVHSSWELWTDWSRGQRELVRFAG